ncbi:hypothetical protein OSB04_011488 [Centaurea solstitialis]|uniref:Glutaredoxin domain-containing protein n=1 Tax=Centaurea solstitialis TaxID=347529 RepID=A0AA38T9I3_9ASTR|nr:hypothetical protein OSB04_011488 [Centaurea solstitialis]
MLTFGGKTYCGYSKRVKQQFLKLDVSYELLELYKESDGNEIQSAVAEWMSYRTIPNVFITGNYIGGCDGEYFLKCSDRERKA